mmetsp:Transcript_11178/g.41811  ORF Transcript_11178/g.41811 Transcript_11178/m.41811 type:complete len:261 (-) Transcript_11178:2307-3089(-)
MTVLFPHHTPHSINTITLYTLRHHFQHHHHHHQMHPLTHLSRHLSLILIFVVCCQIIFLSFTSASSDPQCASLSHHHCSDMSCGTPFASSDLWNQKHASNITQCDCALSDIGARFTSCDKVKGTKSLLYYYKPPVTCSGGQLLPEAVHDIPCEVSCEGGHYFDAASRSCSKCDAGTYAPSQLILFEDFTDEMPSQFDTFCVRENNDCQHWQLRGDYLDSGNNIDKHSVKSALVYSTEVEEGSKVSFEYMVFGEEFFSLNV